MARPRINLSWLRPPKTPDGVMSLADHLRDLRYRVIVAAIAVVVGSIVMAIWSNQLYDVLLLPYERSRDMFAAAGSHVDVTAVISGVTAPFTLILKVCVVAGVIVSSPVWLWQLWAFVAPALREKEKKYTIAFLSVAVPLFLGGVAVAYYVLPQGIYVLLSFTPNADILNLLDLNQFFSLMLRLMMVFGLGFLMPVVIVGLNLAGVLSAKRLAKVRTYVIFAIFVFGAVATPSTDPFSMLALSLPMVVLYLTAEIIARVHDRRHPKEVDT